MKACEQCEKIGELLEAEYLVVGDTAIQTLDVKLKCPEHGEYQGNWTAEQAKALLPPAEESILQEV